MQLLKEKVTNPHAFIPSPVYNFLGSVVKKVTFQTYTHVY